MNPTYQKLKDTTALPTATTVALNILYLASTEEVTLDEIAGGDESPLRVLVVDDDPAMLRLVEEYLTAAGCHVRTATSVAEAVEINCREPAQMVITDWMMPEANGIELCRRLRGDGNLGFVYIIILTVKSEKEWVVEALEAGADDFISKPTYREELLAHVRAGERIIRLEARLAERNREISRN